MGSARAAELTVFAAASLVELGAALQADFEAQSGHQVRIVSGASSTMARQIEKGAPADIYLSANKFWADYVAQLEDFSASKALFGNRLVLVSGAELDNTPKLTDLPKLLGTGHLAIGDPAHVPAGQYAREALENAGVWDALLPHIVPASDVRSAMGFVRSGAAAFGIVYATDVFYAKDVGDSARKIFDIDAALYAPPVYYVVARRDGAGASTAFMNYLEGRAAKDIIEGMGFLPLAP